jgi:rhodanese-related sulfurtransferase
VKRVYARLHEIRFVVGLAGVGEALWSSAYGGLGHVLGKDLDHAAAYAARLGTFWVVVAFVSLAMFSGRKLVRWHRFVREFQMARITPEELKKKLDAGEKVLVVDLHGRKDGPRGHQSIPGAVCIDPHRLRQDAGHDGRIPLRRECEVVLYCTTPHEFTSARVAMELRRAGFERVRPLAGGLQAWHRLGFPLTLVMLCGVDERRRPTALFSSRQLSIDLNNLPTHVSPAWSGTTRFNRLLG